MKKDKITQVPLGKPVHMKMPSGEFGNLVAKPACNKNEGRWYCTFCDELFENQMQKDHHISKGNHELAWICFEHGLEVP